MHALGVEHLSGLTAAVCLIDPGTGIVAYYALRFLKQVDLGIFRPGVATMTGTIDITLRRAVFPVFLLHGNVNIHL